jgi:hypothetical protein
VVNSALVLLALWPLVQMALVRVHGIDPWKLGGWGMYAAPRLPPLVTVECLTADEIGRYELHDVQPTWEREFHEFVWRRRGLGRLARPDALGRALLELYPTSLGIEITVEQPFLDRRTAMIGSETSTYLYPRSHGGPITGTSR